jgi:hypothetical protein
LVEVKKSVKWPQHQNHAMMAGTQVDGPIDCTQVPAVDFTNRFAVPKEMGESENDDDVDDDKSNCTKDSENENNGIGLSANTKEEKLIDQSITVGDEEAQLREEITAILDEKDIEDDKNHSSLVSQEVSSNNNSDKGNENNKKNKREVSLNQLEKEFEGDNLSPIKKRREDVSIVDIVLSEEDMDLSRKEENAGTERDFQREREITLESSSDALMIKGVLHFYNEDPTNPISSNGNYYREDLGDDEVDENYDVQSLNNITDEIPYED